MLISTERAADETVRLERTIGYPRDPDAFSRLRDGLVAACSRHGISPERVITRCLEISKHCPTDFDLFQVAESLREIEPWKPDPPLEHGKPLTDAERRDIDARWQEFINNPKNARAAKGIVRIMRKHGAA